jgi:Na+/H+ antiporter NhaC
MSLFTTDTIILIYEITLIILLILGINKMLKNKKKNLQNQMSQSNKIKQDHLNQQLRNNTRR